jgi:hypothetical protein
MPDNKLLERMDAEISALAQQLANKQTERNAIEKLVAEFPDARSFVGRWDKKVLCSKSVNTKVTDYDMRHNCGCCPDSPLEIWPYVETEYGRMYSDPPCFMPGEKHWMCGDTPSPGWKKAFRNAEIPEHLIDKVASHFELDRQERIKYAEENPDGEEERTSDDE